MDTKSDFTGKHKVILPADYLNSIEAVCEFHEDQINAVPANLSIPGLRVSGTQRLFRFTSVGLGIWLIPVIWLICVEAIQRSLF